MNKKEKNSSVYNYIICILIFLIIILLVILLLNNNGEDNKKIQETPTPMPSILTISLKGNEEESIIVGHEFQDPGYEAHDSKEGNITNKVIVEGNVNENVAGRYKIKYSITNNEGTTKEITRTVVVLNDIDINIDYSPKELTNEKVIITLKRTGDVFDYIKDPDGKINKEKNIEYEVTSNNEYSFLVKRTDGTTVKKNIEIKNIDKNKPTGTCKNTVTNENTTIIVNANDENGIKNYSYNFNNKKEDLETNTYTINEMANNVIVTIYDKAGNYETINCKKIDDTWPVIVNPKYQTHSNKKYNKELKHGKLNYILYYRDDLDLTEKNPLVIYLHGMGEFGKDINTTLQGSSEFTNNMRQGKFQQKAVFIAPQCPSGNKKWVECFDDLKGLIDKIISNYNIDTNKISMTGHSLGGEAVFNFIVEYPGFLAAAAPLAPSRINKDFTKMKDLKISVFTGTLDGLFEGNKTDTAYLISNGVNLRFYPLQDITHSSQKKLYSETNVIDWLVSQSK